MSEAQHYYDALANPFHGEDWELAWQKFVSDTQPDLQHHCARLGVPVDERADVIQIVYQNLFKHWEAHGKPFVARRAGHDVAFRTFLRQQTTWLWLGIIRGKGREIQTLTGHRAIEMHTVAMADSTARLLGQQHDDPPDSLDSSASEQVADFSSPVEHRRTPHEVLENKDFLQAFLGAFALICTRRHPDLATNPQKQVAFDLFWSYFDLEEKDRGHRISRTMQHLSKPMRLFSRQGPRLTAWLAEFAREEQEILRELREELQKRGWSI